MKRVLLLIGMISLILSGCSRTKESNLLFTGTVEATQIDVVAEVGGKVKAIYGLEGDLVEADQILMEIEDEIARLNMLQLEAAYGAQREQLKAVENGPEREEIQIAKQQVAVTEIHYRTAKDNYTHVKELYDDAKALQEAGGVSELQLKEAEFRLQQGEASLQNAEKSMDIARLKLALLEKGSSGEAIRIGQFRADQSMYAYEQAKLQMEKAQIKAPAKGVILYQNFHKGEVLAPGAIVATLLDLEELWVRVYIPEIDLEKVRVGQEMILLSDGMTGEKLVGRVVFISPQAEFTPSNVTTKEERHNRVHEVKVKVIEGIDAIRPGMVVDLLIQNKG